MENQAHETIEFVDHWSLDQDMLDEFWAESGVAEWQDPEDFDLE